MSIVQNDDDLDRLSTEELIKLHLAIDYDNCPWTIHDSHIHGQGLFSSRDIDAGEVIFKDVALISGPRAGSSCESVCVTCLSNSKPLLACSKNCQLPVCSKECESSPHHVFECNFINTHCQPANSTSNVNKDLLRSVTPIRCLKMSPLKKKIMENMVYRESSICEIDLLKRHMIKQLSKEDEAFLRYCCGVLDKNAYGGMGHDSSSNFRGLYALSAVMNHSCFPNTTYWFDNQNRMVVKASSNIRKGDEILSTYASLLWSSSTRRSFLSNTKEFMCQCKRCKDPTEFGTNMSGLLCKLKSCGKLVLPENPLNLKSNWLCSSGNSEHNISAQQAFQQLNVASKVAHILIENEDIEQIYKFLQSFPVNSQPAIQIRKHFSLHSKSSIQDFTDDRLEFKEQSCRIILELMTKLTLGKNYLRGLVLKELYLVLKEKSKRCKESMKEETRETMKTEYEQILSF